MVIKVVLLEGHAIRRHDREVGRHCQGVIELLVLEGEEVGDLMDGEEEGVGRGGTNHVRDHVKVPLIVRIAEVDGQEDLEERQRQSHHSRKGVSAVQFLNLNLNLKEQSKDRRRKRGKAER